MPSGLLDVGMADGLSSTPRSLQGLKRASPSWMPVIEGLLGEDLQRDLAFELRVGGLPDPAHAAFAEHAP